MERACLRAFLLGTAGDTPSQIKGQIQERRMMHMVRSLGKINSNFTKHISPVRHNLESSPEKLLEVQANLPPDSLSQGHTSPWCFAEPTEDQVTRMVGELEDMDIGIFGGFNISNLAYKVIGGNLKMRGFANKSVFPKHSPGVFQVPTKWKELSYMLYNLAHPTILGRKNYLLYFTHDKI